MCGQEELRGVLGRGRDVPECAGTRPVGETSAGVGCRLPRPADRDDIKREARAAIKLSGGGNQPPPDVDKLKLREMASDFAEEASEGELCPKARGVFERNC